MWRPWVQIPLPLLRLRLKSHLGKRGVVWAINNWCNIPSVPTVMAPKQSASRDGVSGVIFVGVFKRCPNLNNLKPRARTLYPESTMSEPLKCPVCNATGDHINDLTKGKIWCFVCQCMRWIKSIPNREAATVPAGAD
jgi:hypothetical protein